MRRSLLSLPLIVAALPLAAGAWGNRETHPRITDAAVRHAEDLDRVFRTSMACHMGSIRSLRPDWLRHRSRSRRSRRRSDQHHGARGWLAFQVDRSFATWPPFRAAPRDVAIDLVPRCQQAFGSATFTACFEIVKDARSEIGKLLRAGSFAEDNPNVRASHHFHDPVKEHDNPLVLFRLFPQPIPIGNRGLDNTSDSFFGQAAQEFFFVPVTRLLRGGGDFRLHGVSARERALGRAEESAFEPVNFYALTDAERYLYRAFTAERPDEREHWMAMHFLAVGSVLHLLEDMGSVAHTRNDFLSDHLGSLQPHGGLSLEDAGEQPQMIRFIRNQLTQSGADLSTSRPVSILGTSSRFPGPYRPEIRSSTHSRRQSSCRSMPAISGIALPNPRPRRAMGSRSSRTTISQPRDDR